MKRAVCVLICVLAAFAAPARAATALFIGDSHAAGPFGEKLDALLRGAPGMRAATYASCGSIALWWTTAKRWSWSPITATCPAGFRARLK